MPCPCRVFRQHRTSDPVARDHRGLRGDRGVGDAAVAGMEDTMILYAVEAMLWHPGEEDPWVEAFVGVFGTIEQAKAAADQFHRDHGPEGRRDAAWDQDCSAWNNDVTVWGNWVQYEDDEPVAKYEIIEAPLNAMLISADDWKENCDV